jgi:hypothetical protein
MVLVFLKLRTSSEGLYPAIILIDADFIYRVSAWMEIDFVTKTLPLPARYSIFFVSMFDKSGAAKDDA